MGNSKGVDILFHVFGILVACVIIGAAVYYLIEIHEPVNIVLSIYLM